MQKASPADCHFQLPKHKDCLRNYTFFDKQGGLSEIGCLSCVDSMSEQFSCWPIDELRKSLLLNLDKLSQVCPLFAEFSILQEVSSKIRVFFDRFIPTRNDHSTCRQSIVHFKKILEQIRQFPGSLNAQEVVTSKKRVMCQLQTIKSQDNDVVRQLQVIAKVKQQLLSSLQKILFQKQYQKSDNFLETQLNIGDQKVADSSFIKRIIDKLRQYQENEKMNREGLEKKYLEELKLKDEQKDREVTTRDMRIKELERLMSETTVECQSLRRQMEDTKRLNELTSQKSQQLLNKIDQREEEIIVLKKTIAGEQEAKMQVEEKYRQWKNEMQAMFNQHMQKMGTKDEGRSRLLKEKTEAIDQLKHERQTLLEKLYQLTQQRDRLKDQAEHQRKRKDDYKAKTATIQAQREALRGKLKTQEQMVEKYTKQYQGQRCKYILQLENCAKEKAELIEQTEKQQNLAQAEIQHLKVQLQTAISRSWAVQKLSQDLEKLRRLYEDSQLKTNQLQSDKAKLEQQKKQLQTKTSYIEVRVQDTEYKQNDKKLQTDKNPLYQKQKNETHTTIENECLPVIEQTRINQKQSAPIGGRPLKEIQTIKPQYQMIVPQQQVLIDNQIV